MTISLTPLHRGTGIEDPGPVDGAEPGQDVGEEPPRGLRLLGWHIQRRRKRGTGQYHVYTYPSKKSLLCPCASSGPRAARRLGVVCEVFGIDRTEDGVPAFGFRVCGPAAGVALCSNVGAQVIPEYGLVGWRARIWSPCLRRVPGRNIPPRFWRRHRLTSVHSGRILPMNRKTQQGYTTNVV